MEFFRLSLQKIVIAKAIGIPLLIADIMFNIFSFFQVSLLIKLIVLIFGSYFIACLVDSFLAKKRKLK